MKLKQIVDLNQPIIRVQVDTGSTVHAEIVAAHAEVDFFLTIWP